MKKQFYTILLAAILPVASAQAGMDIIGGADGAQTMHHCGWLPASSFGYTSDPLVTKVIQKKLVTLGYYHGPIDGLYGRGSKAAMLSFQQDYSLPADGIANGPSVSRLAYATNPAANVGRCQRMASNYFR